MNTRWLNHYYAIPILFYLFILVGEFQFPLPASHRLNRFELKINLDEFIDDLKIKEIEIRSLSFGSSKTIKEIPRLAE